MRELLSIALISLALYAMIRFLAQFFSTIFGSRYRAYHQLAARYRGRCEARGLVDPPTVSFFHHGSMVRVGLAPVVAGQQAPARTRVVIRFPRGIPLRFELFPVGRPSAPQPPRGTRVIRLGDTAFDRAFVVHANDEDLARELIMGGTTQQTILELRKMCPPTGMLISVNPERILTQVDRNLGGNVNTLNEAVAASLRIHDWLLACVDRWFCHGVRVVEVAAASQSEVGPPECEVCGDPITGPHVTCKLCRTPCHRDCWSFVGGCSTFGCGGKEMTPANTAAIRSS